MQLKYNQEIQYHGTEVQGILSNFALEKESLIRDFTEEHKTEILGIQNKTRRGESILLKEHTEKVEQLENEVQRLQHELRTNIENNIQIEQHPNANNETDSEDSEISDIDLEINGEEQIEPININLENIADPENLEFEVIENMAQNRMDLLKYMPKFEGGGKDKDSAAEHVCAFKILIIEIPEIIETGSIIVIVEIPETGLTEVTVGIDFILETMIIETITGKTTTEAPVEIGILAEKDMIDPVTEKLVSTVMEPITLQSIATSSKELTTITKKSMNQIQISQKLHKGHK